MNLEQLLAELFKLDRTVVIEGLQKHLQPVYQAIFDKGHSTATAANKPKLDAAEARVTELEGVVAARDKTIKDLGEKQPDVAKLRSEHEAVVLDLQAKHKKEMDDLKASAQAERQARTLSDLRVELVGMEVDPEYAEVMIAKPDVQKRIRFTADGQPETLQADSGIPFAPVKDKTPIKLLAEDLKTKVPAKWLTSNADRGSETGTGGAGGAKSGSKLFQDIRKSREKATDANKAPSLEQRMGMTAPA